MSSPMDKCFLLWPVKTVSAEGKAPSPFRVLLQGEPGTSQCKIIIKNTFRSVVPLEITRAPAFYEDESVL